ncbi:hypothetical protein B0H63DRAFT_109947 [Podospora didyma]|uniref:Uncharacterized protein n=1 Tax=Podospora didyma TaxID=330526 RepID=A0AAE0NZ35_9PEZI|nr:hypothetical protein B0H63DRAFT_109947 [Podospora didyma]
MLQITLSALVWELLCMFAQEKTHQQAGAKVHPVNVTSAATDQKLRCTPLSGSRDGITTSAEDGLPNNQTAKLTDLPVFPATWAQFGILDCLASATPFWDMLVKLCAERADIVVYRSRAIYYLLTRYAIVYGTGTAFPLPPALSVPTQAASPELKMPHLINESTDLPFKVKDDSPQPRDVPCQDPALFQQHHGAR